MEKSLVKLQVGLLLLNSLSKCPAAHTQCRIQRHTVAQKAFENVQLQAIKR